MGFVLQTLELLKIKIYPRLPRLPRFNLGFHFPGGFEPQMTKEEAYFILGLKGKETAKEIVEKHKHMFLANHPDSGGSPYICFKLNEAKDMILGPDEENKIN